MSSGKSLIVMASIGRRVSALAVASPLERLALHCRQGTAGSALKGAAVTIAGGALIIGEAMDRIPTRTYLRFRLERWGWQKAELAARSEQALHAGDIYGAERPWRDSLAVLTRTLGEEDWEVLEAKVDLAGLLLLQNRSDKIAEAEQLLCLSGSTEEPSLLRRDSDRRMRHRVSRSRVSVLVAQGRHGEAEQLASKCVDQGVAYFGEFDEETSRAKATLREAATTA